MFETVHKSLKLKTFGSQGIFEMFSHPPEARSSLAFTLVLVCSVSNVIYRLCINASGKVIAN